MIEHGIFTRVKHQIEGEASDGGFMLAYRHTDPRESIGFSLVVISKDLRIARVCGIAARVGASFGFSSYSQENYRLDASGEGFISDFLNSFATIMGVTEDQLVASLAARNSLWGFHGFRDGDLSKCLDDDDPAWHPLWQWLEFLSMGPATQPLNNVPCWASDMLLSAMRAFAESYQVA